MTANDMRAEYDFASMKGGVRGKYAKQYRRGTNLVLLEPDLARAFPDDAAVNAALRAALDVAKVVSRKKVPGATSHARPRSKQGTSSRT